MIQLQRDSAAAAFYRTLWQQELLSRQFRYVNFSNDELSSTVSRTECYLLSGIEKKILRLCDELTTCGKLIFFAIHRFA